jgi:hypothetical protein
MAYRNGFCTLQFDPPISAFVARAVSDASPDTWLEIYDEAAQLIECAYTPNVPGTNTYAEIGFCSSTPIAYVRFRAPDISTFFADSIQYETCEEGFVFNMTECIDIDECLAGPCSDHSTCSNTIGSFYCTCDDGYEINNGTCVDIDECVALTPCSEFASCTNTNGSFSCVCDEGFEGTGLGQNGCEVIQTPINSNIPAPASGPSPSTITPSSSITSSAVLSRTHFNLVTLYVIASVLAYLSI